MTATTSLAQALSAQDIIRHYDLMPHVEGGHYRRVWCSSQDLQPESLPCGIYGSRPCSTSILYLADILAGQHLLLPMPGGCWFGAEPCPGTDFSLVSCTVAPGFDFRDFELAKAACLVRRYPFAKEGIEHFCRLPDGCPDPGKGYRE